MDPPHPLTNFEIQKDYQNDNLTEIKDAAYVINLDEYSDIGTHWVALYVKKNNFTYFDCFGVELIPKTFKAFIKN